MLPEDFRSRPDRRETDRAVSEVLGVVLMFGFLVIAFSIYQGVVIPEQNKKAEFQHNERVQGELLNLQDAIQRAGTTGVSQSVSIQVGAEYPDRTLGVNFAVTGGSVTTREPNPGGPNNITFSNVQAVSKEVRDYWNSSTSTLEFPTKDIVYRPVYTRYSNAPETVYSGTATFNRFDQANLSIGDQILVQGNRITIVTINGTLRKSLSGEGASVSVGTEPLSVATNSITIENDGNGPFNLTVPTTVADASAWNGSSLEDQDTVEDVNVVGDNVTITLKNQTYTLRMAKVGVGSGTTEEGAEYIVPVESAPRTVFNDTSHEITVEVRDRFNNPVDSVNVTANVSDGRVSDSGFANDAGAILNRTYENTSSTGEVTFNYTAPSSPPSGGGEITLEFNITDASAGEKVTVQQQVRVVENKGGSGPGSGGNDSQFISITQGPPGTVGSGSVHIITLKVRNGSNLPAKQITVNASAYNSVNSNKNGTFRSSRGDSTFVANFTQKPTDDRGEVRFNYTAPSTLDAEIDLSFSVNTGSTKDNVTLPVNVTSSGAGGGGSGGVLNPGQAGQLRQVNGTRNTSTTVDFYLNNTGSITNLTSYRVAFYFSSENKIYAQTAELNGTTVDIGDPLTPLGQNKTRIPGNEVTKIPLAFTYGGTGNNPDVAGDFFIVTMEFDNGARNTYFVAPQ